MKYALVFWSVAGLCAFHAVTATGPAVALWWPAISFGIAGAAYAGVGPRAFGKRDDGSLSPYAASLLFPYLIYTWGLWHLWRLATREPPYHELYEGVTIGRRLLSGELPKHVGEVLDLTAEFPEPRGIRRRVAYRCFPTLDARPPEQDVLRVAAEQVLSSKHPVLIHCANGHGRTGTLAGAVLLADRRRASPGPLRSCQALCLGGLL